MNSRPDFSAALCGKVETFLQMVEKSREGERVEIDPLLQVVWHENRRVYLSIRKKGKALFLRLHKLFLTAPTPVLEALICFAVNKDKEAFKIVKQMAHLHFSQAIAAPKPLVAQGRCYDLQEILERMQHLLEVPSLMIGWSDQVRVGKFRSITFGTYDRQSRQIRIHPLLDHKDVPLYFVEFIVYHEMLHAVISSQIGEDGRCRIHTAEFRQREKEFPRYEEAKMWAKKSLKFFKEQHGRA